MARKRGMQYIPYDYEAAYNKAMEDITKKEHDLTTTELISIVTDIMSEKSERTR